MSIIPEPAWDEFFGQISSGRHKVVILGTNDAGKSTFVRYIVGKLAAANISVTLIDSDIGQASLGLPGTISMSTFASVSSAARFRAQRVYFVGDFNPARKIKIVLDGVSQFIALAGAAASRAVLVDTSGLVSGKLGIALKLAKIRICKPDHIVAIQKEEELEPILERVGHIKISRLRVSPYVRKRSPAQRANYRKQKFDTYFKGGRDIFLPADGLRFYHAKKALDLSDLVVPAQTLLALDRYSRVLSLGLFIRSTAEGVEVRVPAKFRGNANRIEIGDVSI